MTCPATDAAFSAVTGPRAGPGVPDTFLRFQHSSDPRNTCEYVQAQGSASEVPRRAIFLTTVPVSERDGDSLDSCLAGDGGLSPTGSRRGYGSTGSSPRSATQRASPPETDRLRQDAKQQLIEKVAAKTELKKSEAEVAVDFLVVIAEALQANERVDLSGFGSFVVKERKERQGRIRHRPPGDRK
jgi:hypothetical protein